MEMMNNFKRVKMIGKEGALKTNGICMAGKIKNRRELGLVEDTTIEYVQLPAGFNGVVKEQEVEVEIPKFLLDYQDEIREYKVEYYNELNKRAIKKVRKEVTKLKVKRFINDLLK